MNSFASMNIIVSGDKTVAAVQNEFHENFPYLKIEFFQSTTKGKNRISGNQLFSIFGANGHSNQITITPAITVAELGDKFLTYYNLSAQVFRQSGKAWLETTLTDSWTLEEQNEQGKALSSSNPK